MGQYDEDRIYRQVTVFIGFVVGFAFCVALCCLTTDMAVISIIGGLLVAEETVYRHKGLNQYPRGHAGGCGQDDRDPGPMHLEGAEAASGVPEDVSVRLAEGRRRGSSLTLE